jgi:hypothetical protein
MLKNLRRKIVCKINIDPYIGAGRIKFGDSRDTVRKLLGEFTEFKKSKFSKNTTDDFKFCHVFYDENNEISAVEFFDDTALEYKDIKPFSMGFQGLLQYVKKNSLLYSEDDTGMTISEIGVSIYSPDKSRIESILVFKKGY